jgi:ABC-type multidrug transport system ATPase subunit
MKIILVEDQAGQNAPELNFQQELIKIGRDGAECQIVFPREKYPMVSRQHSEIRHYDNSWVLVDKNSTYGTFLNGKKITQPEQIQVGSTIQIGAEGPKLIVIWLEVGGTSSSPVMNKPPESLPVGQPRESGIPTKVPTSQPLPPVEIKPTPIVNLPPVQPQHPVSPAVKKEPAPVSRSVPQIEFVDKSGVQPFKMTKDKIWLGRDVNCDIVIDLNAGMVSRRHADISRQDSSYILTDNHSFNGTLVNKQRISTPTPLYHGDEIQLGLGGPVLRFHLPEQLPPKGASLAGQRAVAADQSVVLQNAFVDAGGPKTMIFKADVLDKMSFEKSETSQLLMSLTFGSKSQLTIGRDENNDISLDGLQISNRHARLLKTNEGVVVEDLKSTNGVYLNGQRVSRQVVTPDDAVQIGAFEIKVDLQGVIGVFDTRSKTRIDCVKISKEVKNRSGGGRVTLLNDVSISVEPNEFVGLLGPSGAGKSTLMDAMNGMRPATSGSVLINNLDLYENLDSLKQSIGYVPQEDIIHRELTVFKTLYYVAKLRLSRDVTRKEIDEIIEEVLDVTGLTERRDVKVSQLSGGQRKRVSIAVELITKPSVIFLDEPTSGLDPATEEKIMKLFRQIAESGRTVILTTHAMENVKLFDKVVILMCGRLVFYGKPDEALAHVGAKNFKELYDKLEAPVEKSADTQHRSEMTQKVAEDWKQKFLRTTQYKKNISEPLEKVGQVQSQGVRKKRRLGIVGSVRQWMTLSRRYLEVLFKDKLNIFILLAQAPIIAALTFLVMDKNLPRDFVYFVLSLVSVWFGTSVAAREIIRERPIYNRERMVNLGLLPYLFSKLFVLGIIVGIQCLMLFIPLKIFDLVGLMKMPGELLGIPQLWAMLLTAAVGIALGLLISALVKTSEMATSLVPLILIPQILFSGLVGVPTGASRVAGLAMPATWSFDTMKRFSTLDTLKEEGAKPKGNTMGKGLYKFIEEENDRVIDDTKKELDLYKTVSQEKNMRDFREGKAPTMDDPPKPQEAFKIPKDLSPYVNFLHPWMNEVLNQLVLMVMFWLLVLMTLIVLKIQDIG